jgi:hypothetical protein
MPEIEKGKILVTGRSGSNDGDVTGNHGNYDVWVLVIDFDGSIIWSKCIGGSNYDYIMHL